MARACCVLTLICFTLGGPTTSLAQDDGQGGEPEGPRISLTAAVATTLSKSFNLQQAAESLGDRRGAWQRSTGTFDRVFFIDGEFTFAEQELLRAGRDQEIKRRAPLEVVGGWPTTGPPFSFPGLFDVAADELDDFLDLDGASLFDDCEFGQSPTFIDIDTDNTVQRGTGSILDRYSRSTVTLCIDEFGRLRSIVPGSDVGFSNNILFSGTPGLLDLLADLDRLDEETLTELEETISRATTTFLDGLRRSLRNAAADVRISRERLGSLPEVEELLDLKLDIGMQRKFRNGLSLTGSVALVGTEDNYSDKGHDPRDGDTTSPNTFTTSVGLRFEAPLGKGRGRIATAGPERASEALMNAEEHLYVHEASKEALATVNAYWKLAAAQERMELLAVSAQTQSAIREGTRALVEAEEMPGAELWRVEGRYAELLGQVAAAERAIIDARMDLVQAMGAEASTLGTSPLAADPLPVVGELTVDLEPWLKQAYEYRHDLAATAETTRASGILGDTANANLRRQFDFFTDISFSGYHESWTRDQRIWDFSGYRDAVEGKGLSTLPGEDPAAALPQMGMSGPSFTVGIKFTLPIKNLTARGQLLRAQASLAQSEIAERDLKRRIQLRLRDLLPALESKREQLAQQRQTVENQQVTLEASLELYRLGELSLIDTVTTEEELTNSRLQLVDVRLELALLENQTRFESGRLLQGATEPGSFAPSALKLARDLATSTSITGS